MSDSKRTTWETYASAWKAVTAADKHAALRASTVSSCIYRDPLAHTEGHNALVDYMLGFHEQIPGGHFETTYFLDHHDRSIAKWQMKNGADEIVGDGASFGEYDAQGRLISMTGFFETPPQ